MGYLTYAVPIVIMLLGLAAETIIEVSAELSTATLIDADAGVPLGGPVVAAGGIIDMRPEASLPR
ncbi:hypothetical protein [Azospirillum sp. SYSU D00513]|uniref:hypothetical protein n=1 Tax=Azospirillum sp. SYSU D00513 TaxID=2812561 RepID=UPI001A957B2D|nr:hypothetical protein [Azospirillum sp. SYSU D00513]